MIPLKFNSADSFKANAEWGANCGPHALAAALGLTLDEVKDRLEALGPWRGYTTPKQIKALIPWVVPVMAARSGMGLSVLRNTLRGRPAVLRLQWEGPWLNYGVPIRARYSKTHYVAVYRDWVLDTVICPSVSIPLIEWAAILLKKAKSADPKITGWHATHVFIAPPFPPTF